MTVERYSRRQNLIALVISSLIFAGTAYWATAIVAPAATAGALQAHRPIGNNSDLYPQWVAAREVLLLHHDPYSPEVTREIQAGFYGRTIDPARSGEPKDQERFVYPLYVVFLLAPTVTLPFSAVTTFFAWFLLACTAASVPLWIYTLRIRYPSALVVAATLLAVGSYPVVHGLYQQQLTLLVGLLLAAAVASAVSGRNTLSGILLALSTIKPQLSGLLLLWFAVWVIRNWKERRRLFLSFIITLATLFLSAEILAPRWIVGFIAAIRDYQRYASDQPILELLLTPWLGRLAAAALVFAVLVLLWRWKSAQAGSRNFSLAVVLVLALTLVVLPKAAPYNQVLLIPAFLFLVSDPGESGAPRWLPEGLRKAVFACQSWQWGAACGLAVATIVVPLARVQNMYQLPLYTLFALPPIVLFALLLRVPWKTS